MVSTLVCPEREPASAGALQGPARLHVLRCHKGCGSDHCCNIAEDVVYLIGGDIVRRRHEGETVSSEQE